MPPEPDATLGYDLLPPEPKLQENVREFSSNKTISPVCHPPDGATVVLIVKSPVLGS